jgi:hypothetical protein
MDTGITSQLHQQHTLHNSGSPSYNRSHTNHSDAQAEEAAAAAVAMAAAEQAEAERLAAAKGEVGEGMVDPTDGSPMVHHYR